MRDGDLSRVNLYVMPELMGCRRLATLTAVMPREGGASSIRKRSFSIAEARDYWIARLRGR
jgi:hypothetical protein